MLTKNEMTEMIANIGKPPFPNKYSRQILKCLHNKTNRGLVAVDCVNYDSLGNLTDDGCFLGIRGTASPCLSYNKSNTFTGRPDLYFSLNICYPSHPNTIETIPGPFELVRGGAMVSYIQKNGVMSFKPVDINISLNRFAAMLRMFFGVKGFHYLCSLSINSDIQAFCSRNKTADVDYASVRMLTQDISKPNNDGYNYRIGGLGPAEIYLCDDPYCRAAMLKSISNKKLRDVTEMSMKL